MRKRLIGLAIVLLAAWGSGCSATPPPEEPAQWSAIKFVPQESAETARDQEKSSQSR